jgi:hypothetical protein
MPLRTLLILVYLFAIATTHLYLAATPLSLPGSGTFLPILSVLHVDEARLETLRNTGANLRIPSNGASNIAHVLSINYRDCQV